MVCLLLQHACSALTLRTILPGVNGVKTGPYLCGTGFWFPKQGDIAHALLHPLKARTEETTSCHLDAQGKL